MKRSFILIKNISSNFSAQVWLMIVSFFATPFIFSKLGAAKYGLLVLINSIPNYFSVLDFGLNASIIKKISEFKAKKIPLDKLISTAIISYTIVTIIWSIVIYILANLLAIKILKIPPQLTNVAIISLQLVAFSFFLNSLTTFFSSIPQALQKFEIYNLKNFITGTFIPLGSILVLLMGKSIKEIIYVHIIVNFLNLVIFYLIAKIIHPGFKINFNFNLKYLKDLLSFGGFKFISNVNAKILFQLNNFLIATFLPINLVSYYAIPASLTQKIISLIPNITSPIFPLTSELHSLALKNKLKLLYIKSVRAVNFLVFPIIIFLYLFSDQLLSVWINKDFSHIASPILKILAISYLLASLPAVPKIVIEGIGKPKIPAFFSTINAVVYLLLALVFIPKYQLIGAALAVLMSRMLQAPAFVMFTTAKFLEIKNLKHYWQNYLSIFVIGLVSIIPFLFFAKYIISILLLGLFSFSYFIVFILLCIQLQVINKQDKDIFLSFVKLFKK